MTQDQKRVAAIIQRCHDRAAPFRSLVVNCNKRSRNYPLLIRTYWHWLSGAPSGIYSSPEVEQFFVDMAAELPGLPVLDAVENAVLVVMSEAFEYGGHTRWVEKWIAADSKRVYSLALTRKPNNGLPKYLERLILGRGGKVYYLEKEGSRADALLEKAAELRDLSLLFHSVLLAVHMDDPLPLVAYGDGRFPRPVAFLNHGNHLFWLGISVADVVVECGKWQQDISTKWRGVLCSELVYFPLYASMPECLEPRDNLRRRLLLPEKAFVVMTAGPSTKYGSDRGVKYTDFINRILNIRNDVYFLAVGMTWESVPEWQELKVKYPERMKVLDRMPLDSFHEYCFAADILVDSFPFSGGGVMLEASVCGCPCFTQRRTFGVTSYLNHFSDVSSLTNKIRECVDDKRVYSQIRERCIGNIRDTLAKSTSREALCRFMDRFDALRHEIHQFEPVQAPIDENDYVIFETQYFGNADKTFARYMRWYAMKPCWIGFLIAKAFSWLRGCYANARHFIGVAQGD